MSKSERTVRRHFDRLAVSHNFKKTDDRHINLTFDGVYFGRELCYMVFRAESRTIYFEECQENVENIGRILMSLEREGYVFKSFTVDGRKGIKQYLKSHYPDVPIQHCLFHQKAAITRYLTGRPKTECGRELKELIQTLGTTDRTVFEEAFNALNQRFRGFLKERNENGQFSHRRLRSAFRSIKKNLPELFTFQEYPGLKIPTTTNSCEGYFGQLKRKARVHSGLTREHLKKVIMRLLLGR